MKAMGPRTGIGALVILTLALTAGAHPVRAVLLNVHLYKQCNSAWGSHQLGTCLKNSGGYSNGCYVYWVNSCMPQEAQWMVPVHCPSSAKPIDLER